MPRDVFLHRLAKPREPGYRLPADVKHRCHPGPGFLWGDTVQEMHWTLKRARHRPSSDLMFGEKKITAFSKAPPFARDPMEPLFKVLGWGPSPTKLDLINRRRIHEASVRTCCPLVMMRGNDQCVPIQLFNHRLSHEQVALHGVIAVE